MLVVKGAGDGSVVLLLILVLDVARATVGLVWRGQAHPGQRPGYHLSSCQPRAPTRRAQVLRASQAGPQPYPSMPVP